MSYVDAFGTELNVGDTVAFCGWANPTVLQIGTIDKLENEKVLVSYSKSGEGGFERLTHVWPSNCVRKP